MITYLFKFNFPVLVLELILRKYFNQANHHGAKSFSFLFLYSPRKPVISLLCLSCFGVGFFLFLFFFN